MPRTRDVGLLVLALFILAGHSAAQERKDPKPGADKQAPHPRLKAVRELDPPSFTDTFTVYYSTGHQRRAKEFSGLIKEMARFYEEKLKIKADLSVAVLTKADWERVEKMAPYRIPSVSPARGSPAPRSSVPDPELHPADPALRRSEVRRRAAGGAVQ